MPTLDYFRLRIGLTSRPATVAFVIAFSVIGATSYQMTRSLGLLAEPGEEAPWAATSVVATAAVAGLYQVAVAFAIFMTVSTCHQFTEHGYHWLGSVIAERRRVIGLEVKFCCAAAFAAAVGFVLSSLLLSVVGGVSGLNGHSSLIDEVRSSLLTTLVVWVALFCCGLFGQMIAHLFRSVAICVAVCGVAPMFIEPLIAAQLGQFEWVLPVSGVVAACRDLLNYGWGFVQVLQLTAFVTLAALIALVRFRKETLA